jgi:hypothetical protein
MSHPAPSITRCQRYDQIATKQFLVHAHFRSQGEPGLVFQFGDRVRPDTAAVGAWNSLGETLRRSETEFTSPRTSQPASFKTCLLGSYGRLAGVLEYELGRI